VTTELVVAATAFDIRNPETIVHELEGAGRRLRGERTVPGSILGLLADLCEDIGNADVDETSDLPPGAWMAVQSTALRALSAIRHDEDQREQRRKLRLLIEELRFRLARLAEEQPVSEARPVKDVVRWLDQAWNVSQATKGDVFGVSDRTWQRWVSSAETSQPSGDEDRRVRLVARLVADLRYLLTSNGVLDWLTSEDPALDSGTPLNVIRGGDVDELRRLLSLVAQARAGGHA
jgi:hypothetical protein